MTLPKGYTITSYGDMITDQPRMEAYAKALRAAVRPGCIVLDIGAGTGVFSLLSCRFGAGHVHAVEPDEAITLAREAIVANGYSDRVTLHQALSSKISLPVPADVIVSDLRSVLPLFQHHIPSIIDARERLLSPGGRLIPLEDRIWGAMVEDADIYRSYQEPWLSNAYGLDLQSGHRRVINTWRKVYIKPEQLLVEPRKWATLDYQTIESPNIAGELHWTAKRSGTAHGLTIWFDATLGDETGFSNAPGQPELIYGQVFFPLQQPVRLAPGDEIQVDLRADLAGNDYEWRWHTRIEAAGDSTVTKAAFNQSTFFGSILSPARLRLRNPEHAPALDEQGQADLYLLSAMDGKTSLSEIAKTAAERFPGLFSDQEAALNRSRELSYKYSI